VNAILYNGIVYPGYRTCKRPSALVISGNKIAALGNNLSYLKQQFPGHRLIDLKGRVILPGFVDSHTHFYFWATTLDTVHLERTTTFNETLVKIKKFARKCPLDEWIVGDGWSPDQWDEYHLPTAFELDGVTGGRPAALFSKDQHMLWVNSGALQMAGIDRHYPEPEGGSVDRDPATGEPTGILREVPGYMPVVDLFSKPKPERAAKAWKRAARIAYSRGVTGFHSVDAPEAWEFFTSRHKAGKLGFRVHYYFPVNKLDELIERKFFSGTGDDTLRVGGVKIFADGSLGSQTAFLKKPYLKDNDNYGIEVTGLKDLISQTGRASKNNLACAVHAIGDRAVANVITAFERAGGGKSLRHRIEHLQLIDRKDISRLKKTGAVASMQPSHCPSDRKLVDTYWGRRGHNAYIFKTLLNQQIPLAFGSDCPIEPLDPLGGIHAAVNRNDFGERGGRFYPEERITVSQAVHGFTAGAAYAAGREKFSGKIAAGCQADLVILDDNIHNMPPSKIYGTNVAATIFDGKVVYRSSSFKA
jgi:predicted amidohydrolase YtcJ